MLSCHPWELSTIQTGYQEGCQTSVFDHIASKYSKSKIFFFFCEVNAKTISFHESVGSKDSKKEDVRINLCHLDSILQVFVDKAGYRRIRAPDITYYDFVRVALIFFMFFSKQPKERKIQVIAHIKLIWNWTGLISGIDFIP